MTSDKRTIYASFDTIDQAENCARELRRRCEGVKAVKIRFREVKPQNPDLPVSAYAMYDTIGVGDPAAAGLYPGGFGMPVMFDSDLPPAVALDGPAGRTDCAMEVSVTAEDAKQAVQLIRSLYGRKVELITPR